MQPSTHSFISHTVISLLLAAAVWGGYSAGEAGSPLKSMRTPSAAWNECNRDSGLFFSRETVDPHFSEFGYSAPKKYEIRATELRPDWASGHSQPGSSFRHTERIRYAF